MNARQIFYSVVALALQVPLLAAAAGLVPCGGNGEQACQMCHFVDLAQNVAGWLVGVLSIAAAIMFAIAGFRLVTANGNPSVMKTAKDMIVNVAIGFAIVLAAWLLIDLVMKSLLTNGQTKLGPWNNIACVTQPVYSIVQNITNASSLTQAYGAVDPNLAPAVQVTGNCSPTNLQSHGMSAQQAQVMSCIATAESGCISTAHNPNSSAAGLFQITRGWNDSCHNLNIPECATAARAAGWTGSGDLNCSTAFSGGRAKPGSQLAVYCNRAAENDACNIKAAVCLLNGAPKVPAGYGHWTGNAGQNHHLKQRACVAKYGG